MVGLGRFSGSLFIVDVLVDSFVKFLTKSFKVTEREDEFYVFIDDCH